MADGEPNGQYVMTMGICFGTVAFAITGSAVWLAVGVAVGAAIGTRFK